MNLRHPIIFKLLLALFYGIFTGVATTAAFLGFGPGFLMEALMCSGFGFVASLPVSFFIVGPLMKQFSKMPVAK